VSNVRAIVTAFANRFAEAGQAVLEIQTARTWASLASGNYTQLLNQIGKIAGAVRPFGASDQEYVSYVKATIAANHSNGHIEDIYTIARLLLPPQIGIKIVEFPPASFILHLTDTVGLLGAGGAAWTEPYPLAAGADGTGSAPFGDGNSGSLVVDALTFFLHEARPAGVWAVVSYTLSKDAHVFKLDTAAQLDSATALLRGWSGP
jgi:hypothetical protein